MAELDLASLVVSVRADVRDAATGIDNLNSKIDSIGKTTEQAGADTARIQQEMSKGWIGLSAQLQAFNELSNSIGKPLLGFFKGAVEGASDLQETVSKTNVVFKDYAEDVLDWSESATKTMGLSKESALSMAASFGDLATSMGLTTSTSQQMAMNLTQLAADLASFKNIDADQAFTALQGIFTGNAQALKGLGIVMNETTLEAYAMSQGITTSYQSMSESEKVALRYQYVLEQTVNAQGDFARTGGGYANATRTLSESISELTSSFGEMLLPMLEGVIGVITNLVQFINDMPAGLKAVVVALGIAATAFTVIIPLIAKATALFEAFKASTTFGVSLIVSGITAAVAGVAALIASFASANSKAAKDAAEIKKQAQSIKSELAALEGDYSADFDIFVKDNSSTVAQNLENVASKFSGSAASIKGSLAAMVEEYDQKNLSIQVGVTATGWAENGSPDDVLDDEDRNVDVDLTAIGLDKNDIDGGTIDVDAVAGSFDTDGIQGADIEVDAIADGWEKGKSPQDITSDVNTEVVATGWKKGRSPEQIAKEYKIPIVAGNELIVDYNSESSFKNLNKFIADNLTAIDVNINAGDASTAMTYAYELQTFLNSLKIQANTQSEIDFVNEFLNGPFADIQAALTALTVGIENVDTSKISKDTIQRYLNAHIRGLTLNAKLAALDTKNAQEKYDAFKAGIENAENAIKATIYLKEATDQDTTQAAALLDTITSLKDEYSTKVDTEISEEDIAALNSVATDLGIIIATDKSVWGGNIKKSLEEIHKSLYKKTTGKDSSGNMLKDLKEIRSTIDEGLGSESAWKTLMNHITEASSATASWESIVEDLNTAFNNVLNNQISLRQAELERRLTNLVMAYNETEDEAERARIAKEYQSTQQALTTTTEMASEGNQLNVDWQNDTIEEAAGKVAKFGETVEAAGTTLERATGKTTALYDAGLASIESNFDISTQDLVDAGAKLLGYVKELPVIQAAQTPEDLEAKYQADRQALVDERAGVVEDVASRFTGNIQSIFKQYVEAQTNSLMPGREATIAQVDRGIYSSYSNDFHNAINEISRREKELSTKIDTLDTQTYPEEQTKFYREILGEFSKFQGVGEFATGKEVQDAIDANRQLYEKADAEQKVYLDNQLAYLSDIKDVFDAQAIAKYFLEGQIPEDVIAGMSDASKELAQTLNGLIEEGGLTDPTKLAEAVAALGQYLGYDLIQSGATNTPMETGDHIENQTNISGNNHNGDNYYNYRTYNVITKTGVNDTLESQVQFENDVDSATAGSLGS